MDGRTDEAGYSRVVENSVFDKMHHLGHQGGATRRVSLAVTPINHFEAIWQAGGQTIERISEWTGKSCYRSRLVGESKNRRREG